MDIRIVDFEALSERQRGEAAHILRAAFAHMPATYAEAGEAEAEVASFFSDDERSAMAALEGDTVAGWIGRIEAYSHSWELHPLAVDPSRQRRGIGARLLAELENRARTAGMLTLWLGSDDDYGGTSLFGVDVFPGVLRHAAAVEQSTRHPIAFYRKHGFEVVGLLPDANGFGKPDILMAKRLAAGKR